MKKTLLFVDDEEMNLFILDKLFAKEFEVLTANSAKEGLLLIKEEAGNIDAVITDLKMPETTGLQMLKEAADLLNDVPKFLLTGYNHHHEIEEALANKTIDGVFKKPFDFNQMKDALVEHTQ